MQPSYSPNTVNQTVSVDGGKTTWRGQPGGGWTLVSGGGDSSNSGGGSGATDVVGNAQKLLDFQKTANAPVAQALGSQVPGIQDQYTQLVNSIKGNQQLDTNRQTLATSNELGARGILPSSGLYQQQMTDALTPIDTQYSGLLTQANTGSIQDLQGLALQIAQLNAGNPDTAISGGLSIAGLQSALQVAQANAQGYIGAAQANPYESFGQYGQTLNKQTGAIDSSGISALIKALNGGL